MVESWLVEYLLLSSHFFCSYGVYHPPPSPSPPFKIENRCFSVLCASNSYVANTHQVYHLKTFKTIFILLGLRHSSIIQKDCKS